MKNQAVWHVPALQVILSFSNRFSDYAYAVKYVDSYYEIEGQCDVNMDEFVYLRLDAWDNSETLKETGCHQKQHHNIQC